MDSNYKDGDVIVAAGIYKGRRWWFMNNDFYHIIGLTVVWCAKYMFIPLGVAIFARVIAEKLLRPQPKGQKKKRFRKNRLK